MRSTHTLPVEPPNDYGHVAYCVPPSKVFFQGAALAIINPKTLVFNSTILAQFADCHADPIDQMIVLAAVFLVFLSAGDSLWAITADSAQMFIVKYDHLRN